MKLSAGRREVRGFTAVDLITLISVLGLLGGLARLSRADRLPRSCRFILQELGRATQLYAFDNSDQLPGCQHTRPSWTQSLQPYARGEAFLCPVATAGAPAFNYALNDFLTQHPYGSRKLDYSKLSRIPTPAATLMFSEIHPALWPLKLDHFHFAESQENGFAPTRFRQQVDVQRHESSANYLFPDGHVDSLTWLEIETRLTTKTTFIHPEGAIGGETTSQNRFTDARESNLSYSPEVR